ncbi:hypothetical protein DKX38_014969 [Salix brachista]|uniref:Uncharacterized protein n=1 Tax=Salix brachista TaxID=2182728 RepID=A0A5N5L5W6_9ROSI|nr:hypothetical protein DKX38_014969 [Salix brachista]
MDGHDADDAKKSTADMTAFVQTLLQQMQSRFQTMSDSIVTKNILFFPLILFPKCLGCLYEKGQFHYYLSSLMHINGISLHLSEMAFVRNPLGISPASQSSLLWMICYLTCISSEFYDSRSDVAVSIWDSCQKSYLIDELEQSINDLRTEMGVEGSPSPSVPPSVKEEPKSGNDSA